MSSIDTGSSATSSTGSRMIARAITARCFCPPERSPGYFSMNCSAPARARPARAPPPTRRRSSSLSETSRGSAAGRRRLPDRHRRVQRRMRVLEDDLHPPPQRAAAPDSLQPRDLARPRTDAALGRRDEAEQGPAERRLAASPTRRRRRAPRPCAGRARRRRRPARPGLAAVEAVEELAADRVGACQVADLEQELGAVRVSTGMLMPPLPRGTPAAPSGSRRRRGSGCSGPCSQHGPAGRSRAADSIGSRSAQTRIASGQRGWKRQPLGGSTRLGGAPGMSCSAVVSSEIVERSSSRVYGCAGSAKTSRAAPPRRSCPRT